MALNVKNLRRTEIGKFEKIQAKHFKNVIHDRSSLHLGFYECNSCKKYKYDG